MTSAYWISARPSIPCLTSRFLAKLEYNGIDGTIRKWVFAFLNNREQKVNGSYSSPVSVDSDVSRDTVLGPLLFPLTKERNFTGEFPSQRPVTWSLMFSLICAWTNGWINNRDAGNLRRHRAHYDITVIAGQQVIIGFTVCCSTSNVSMTQHTRMRHHDGRHIADDIFICILLNKNTVRSWYIAVIFLWRVLEGHP